MQREQDREKERDRKGLLCCLPTIDVSSESDWQVGAKTTTDGGRGRKVRGVFCRLNYHYQLTYCAAHARARTCGILPPFSCPFPEAGSTPSFLPSRRPFWPPNRRREMETEFGGNAPNERTNASAEMALPDPPPRPIASPNHTRAALVCSAAFPAASDENHAFSCSVQYW